MGNSSSSGRGHHDESVDYGSLVPQGVYTGPRDWNQAIVSQLIVGRRLAPFYRPLEEYEDSWDDDQILAARKELPDLDSTDSVTRIEAAPSAAAHASSYRSKRPGSLKEPARPEAQVYRGAVECPICFLYYPPNINHSRCCDQAICTECFVQIKRAEPTTTHLVSEPAACPYCVQDNFGVVYAPPPWRAGLGSEGSNPFWSDTQRSSEPTAPPTHKRRQKSFGADSPEVVTTVDQIRPDWEAKLEAIRAAVARRANRRIIMRQVGDRLIPVGVTSGRVHALSPEEAAAAASAAESNGSRRGRRRQGNQNGPFEQFMGMAGQDLEELMLMEAMRLSLLDHEEHQRKEAEEKKKQQSTAPSIGESGTSSTEAVGPSETQSRPGPGPSTLETRSSLQASTSSILSSSPSSKRSISPAPKHTKVGSQDSLAPGRKSWSISRSRTPPPPTNPVPNLPVSEENQTAWRNRTTGPPAFSTLSAALTSTSTAAAFLGAASSSEQRSSRSVTPEPGSALLVTSSVPANSSIPTITVANNDTESGITTTRAPSAISTKPTSQDSESGAGIGFGSYGPLPSSPESDMDMSYEHSMGSLDSTTKMDGQVNSGAAAGSAFLDEHSR
ncbi:hypothetical protein M413DRAFT_59264 [Hebeloma cylindrosporum]|uniref:RING-type domain-containing protein n=1 Tax=Hebeloma cylindrosporum TaxID=76867 RepID=A0A0C2Z8H4_HEBCY|nr:hypothetical protein M413DRAFT_59264 [Hebeloma cylindrosporum h7]